MVNLLETPRVIVFFFLLHDYYYIIDLLRLFQKRSFVLSSEHENQNVATIGTLLHQLMLRAPVCKNQTNSKFRGKSRKFDFFHILMLERLGYS